MFHTSDSVLFYRPAVVLSLASAFTFDLHLHNNPMLCSLSDLKNINNTYVMVILTHLCENEYNSVHAVSRCSDTAIWRAQMLHNLSRTVLTKLNMCLCKCVI